MTGTALKRTFGLRLLSLLPALVVGGVVLFAAPPVPGDGAVCSLASLHLQDFRSAAEQFALAAGLNPQLQEINFNWGLACYKAELYQQAIAPLENELKANANNLAAKQLLGMSYFMADNYARAAQLLTDVVAVKKNDAGLYYTLAISLIKQGKQEQANQVIQQMVAAAGNSVLHTLAVADASDALGISGADTTTFMGETVDATSVLIRYTYGGDANLDGKVNVDDYTWIDGNIGLGTSGWYNGDFNYDGKVNVDDYTIIDSNIGIQGAPFFTAGGAGGAQGALNAVSAVPEPSLASLWCAAGALAALRRRRRASGPARA